MKLFSSQNSPYSRKCRIVMIEKGLEKRIELIQANPLENPKELLSVNPLGTVPALVTDQGLHLCDSTVICEYLDTLSAHNPLLPPVGGRECVLAFVAMADGIMDAAVACVMEGRRPEDKQYAAWVERKELAISRAIAKFATVPLDQTLSMGTIALGVALAYVSFRRPHIAWRGAHPVLAQWFDMFTKRPSFEATKPQA
jgi:glutathione S-transferase